MPLMCTMCMCMCMCLCLWLCMCPAYSTAVAHGTWVKPLMDMANVWDSSWLAPCHD